MEEKANLYQKGTSKKEATVRLIGLIKSNNKPIITKSKDGEEAYISVKSIGKLMSKPAVDKSVANGFSREQHFAAVSDIDNLFRNSVKVLTHPDKGNDPNIKAMHRFVAPLFGDNVAYITVKEAIEHGKRIYSVELMEIGKLEGTLNRVKSNFTQAPATSLPIK